MRQLFDIELELPVGGEDGDEYVDCKVTYSVSSWGCPAQLYGPAEHCYPAESPEWDVVEVARLDTGEVFVPTTDHEQAIEQAIAEDVMEQLSEPDDGPEYEREWAD